MRALSIISVTTILVIISSGCATLFNSSTKGIALASEPTGAEVFIDGNRMGITPITLELDQRMSHSVVFRKAGYSDVTCELTSSAGAGWVVLDILAGVVPIVIDAVTGDWKGISQDACNVNLPSGQVQEEVDGEMTSLAKERQWMMLQPE